MRKAPKEDGSLVSMLVIIRDIGLMAKGSRNDEMRGKSFVRNKY